MAAYVISEVEVYDEEQTALGRRLLFVEGVA